MVVRTLAFPGPRAQTCLLLGPGANRVGSGQDRAADVEGQEGQSSQSKAQPPVEDCLVTLLAGTLAGVPASRLVPAIRCEAAGGSATWPHF